MELLLSHMVIFQTVIQFHLFPSRMTQLLDVKTAEHTFVPSLDG